VEPTIVLAGAPDTGKRDLARKLADKLGGGYVEMEETDQDIGFLTDYRRELQLAIRRMSLGYHMMPVVHTHSLLDNLVYSLGKVEQASKWGNVSQETDERNALTAALIGAIFYDSYNVDKILFLKKELDREEEFDQWYVQFLMETIFEEFKELNVVTLDADSEDLVEKALEALEEGNGS
jgi:deoxyadenosine/deoxycytidine kinase